MSGKVGDEPVSIAIFDAPSNPGYPTYWHARGYGLFAANPLGQKELSLGKDVLNFAIEPKTFVETAANVIDTARPPARVGVLDQPARQGIGLAIHAGTACSSPARRARSIAPSTPARPCSAETHTEFSTQPSGSCGGK